MIYLASPYSHADALVREQWFHEACVVTARLLNEGTVVFSPVVFGHSLVAHCLPTDWPFWEPFAREHIARCDEVLILMLDGWRESVGVAAEIGIAGELGKPIRYLAPEATVSPTLAHFAKEDRL